MKISLFLFIGVIWLVLISVSAFLVIFIAPIEVNIFQNRTDLYVTSIIQAIVAILVVILLIFILSFLKRMYIQKKL